MNEMQKSIIRRRRPDRAGRARDAHDVFRLAGDRSLDIHVRVLAKRHG